MRKIFLICCSVCLFACNVEAGSKLMPPQNGYVRKNIFGGYDYYSVTGRKLGFSKTYNKDTKYYLGRSKYLGREYGNGRVYINPNVKFLGD